MVRDHFFCASAARRQRASTSSRPMAGTVPRCWRVDGSQHWISLGSVGMESWGWESGSPLMPSSVASASVSGTDSFGGRVSANSKRRESCEERGLTVDTAK